MDSSVSFNDIVAGLRRVGAAGRCAVVHASLSSFGWVSGGADTVVDALLDVCETVVVPTFTFAPAAHVPPDDRVERNGADYDEDPCGGDDPTPFTPDLPAAKAMGVVAERLRRRSGALRSDHPLSSFAAIGRDARRYLANHDWNDPTLPLQRLCDDGGLVLLLGTSLTSCTTIHLGERQVGRRPFIRWANVAGAGIRRVRVGGCSAGFEALAPRIADIRWTRVGKAGFRAMSMQAVVRAVVTVLREDRFALVCPARCRRCLDAADGGPRE